MLILTQLSVSLTLSSPRLGLLQHEDLSGRDCGRGSCVPSFLCPSHLHTHTHTHGHYEKTRRKDCVEGDKEGFTTHSHPPITTHPHPHHHPPIPPLTPTHHVPPTPPLTTHHSPTPTNHNPPTSPSSLKPYCIQ